MARKRGSVFLHSFFLFSSAQRSGSLSRYHKDCSMLRGISRVCRVKRKAPVAWGRDYVDFLGFSRTGNEMRFILQLSAKKIRYKAHRVKWLARLKSIEIWGRGCHLHGHQIAPQMGTIISQHNAKLEVLNHMKWLAPAKSHNHSAFCHHKKTTTCYREFTSNHGIWNPNFG